MNVNNLKVGFLLVAMTAIFMGVGRMVAGQNGMIIALVFALVMNIGSYWFSDKIVLGMSKARPITAADEPALFQMVEALSKHAGLPMPRLYIIDDPQPNAFATGRDPKHAAVAVNRGLLDSLNMTEVAGVVAHELTHVKNRDTLTMAIVTTLASAIMGLVQMAQFSMIFGGGRDRDDRNPLAMIAAILLAPLAAAMVQGMVSQAREFEADAGAARLMGSADGLISALGKLERGANQMPSNVNPQTAHMYIVNPFGDLAAGVQKLRRSHPATAERIAALRALHL